MGLVELGELLLSVHGGLDVPDLDQSAHGGGVVRSCLLQVAHLRLQHPKRCQAALGAADGLLVLSFLTEVLGQELQERRFDLHHGAVRAKIKRSLVQLFAPLVHLEFHTQPCVVHKDETFLEVVALRFTHLQTLGVALLGKRIATVQAAAPREDRQNLDLVLGRLGLRRNGQGVLEMKPSGEEASGILLQVPQAFVHSHSRHLVSPLLPDAQALQEARESVFGVVELQMALSQSLQSSRSLAVSPDLSGAVMRQDLERSHDEVRSLRSVRLEQLEHLCVHAVKVLAPHHEFLLLVLPVQMDLVAVHFAHLRHERFHPEQRDVRMVPVLARHRPGTQMLMVRLRLMRRLWTQ
eukprot:scaffold363_cov255-Pinguiococcus_pyrenoidosus.AAC.7